ncbi:MAG TPA: hypothetical protein VEP90_15470 [Methylomirabilota bacterium]|nr:hypothetical protein [Methylomirabilota bacterium]
MTDERKIVLGRCDKDGALLVSNDDHFHHCHYSTIQVTESEFKIIQKQRRQGRHHIVMPTGEVREE